MLMFQTKFNAQFTNKVPCSCSKQSSMLSSQTGCPAHVPNKDQCSRCLHWWSLVIQNDRFVIKKVQFPPNMHHTMKWSSQIPWNEVDLTTNTMKWSRPHCPIPWNEVGFKVDLTTNTMKWSRLQSRLHYQYHQMKPASKSTSLQTWLVWQIMCATYPIIWTNGKWSSFMLKWRHRNEPASFRHVGFSVEMKPASFQHIGFSVEMKPASFQHIGFSVEMKPASFRHIGFSVEMKPASFRHIGFSVEMKPASFRRLDFSA